MAENNRKAKQMVISFVQELGKRIDVPSSRTTVLNSYDSKKICDETFEVIKKYCERSDGSFCVKFLGISVGNFEEIKKVNEITSYFKVNDKSPLNKNTILTKVNSKNMQHNNQSFSFVEENLENMEITSKKDNLENAEENSCSVFSLSTEAEDDLNTENLQFYDEKFKINPQELETEESSNDSISGELNKSKIQTQQEPKKDTNSFFVRYFQNLQSPNESIKRDFNTSKNLEEDEVAEFEEISDIPSTSNCEKASEICPECGKNIPILEITSHADYHFALEIVKSEADLYKPKAVKIVDTKKNKSTFKRKLENDGKSSVLEEFLKNATVNVSNDCEGKICKDCGKVVPESDWESHADYHVAKKLHLEINSPQNFPKTEIKKTDTSKNTPRSDSKKDGTSDSKGKIKPVTSFFKTL